MPRENIKSKGGKLIKLGLDAMRKTKMPDVFRHHAFIGRDAWNVQVKNPCEVDSVTIALGFESKADKTFEPNPPLRKTKAEAQASAAGQAAEAEARGEARKALPRLLFREGNRLCAEWEKLDAPAGAPKCKAVRGDLNVQEGITCTAEYEGVKNHAVGSSPPRWLGWKVTVTCTTTADAHYVCDP